MTYNPKTTKLFEFATLTGFDEYDLIIEYITTLKNLKVVYDIEKSRRMDILDLFKNNQSLSADDISQMIKLSKVNTHKHISTLLLAGFLSKTTNITAKGRNVLYSLDIPFNQEKESYENRLNDVLDKIKKLKKHQKILKILEEIENMVSLKKITTKDWQTQPRVFEF